jgi:hypothetical protein
MHRNYNIATLQLQNAAHFTTVFQARTGSEAPQNMKMRHQAVQNKSPLPLFNKEG